MTNKEETKPLSLADRIKARAKKAELLRSGAKPADTKPDQPEDLWFQRKW
jgi:hypothetical protein